MVSLNSYLRMRRAMELLAERTDDPADAEYAWHFLRPYVCTIHEPTGKGYYLNRNYQLILSVDSIPRPGHSRFEIPELLTRVISHETQQQHRSSNAPEWAEALPVEEFTTYWLY